MSEEKKRILEMVQAGKITAFEGLELLEALEGGGVGEAQVQRVRITNRFLRVKVSSLKNNVNIKLPLGLFRAASKLANVGMRLIPAEAQREMREKGVDITQLDFEELISLIDEGLVDGKLVDVDADDPEEGRTRVEVYVE